MLYCSLDGRLFASGNRILLLSPTAVEGAIAEQTGSFHSSMEGLAEDGGGGQPLTSIYCSAISQFPPAPLDTPEATKTGHQRPALEFLTAVAPVNERRPDEEAGLVGTDDSEDDEAAKTANILGAQKITEKASTHQHKLGPKCATFRSCQHCLEDSSGQTYLMRLQVAGFKAHISRLPVKDIDAGDKTELTKYRYLVNYIEDPTSLQLSTKYEACYRHHLSLRKVFEKLPADVKGEFTKRLSSGLGKDNGRFDHQSKWRH